MLRRRFARTLAASRGRFLSIVALMALGSFALVGLSVTGPDMVATGTAFYGEHNLADVTVVGDYGLTDDDIDVIAAADDVRIVESQYFADVVVANSDHALRIFSLPQAVSTPALVEGRMPEQSGEIALSAGERESFAVGSTITVDEPAGLAGDTVLTATKYTVVGFADASDIVSRAALGQSTAGSGELSGYGYVTDESFDSDVTMVANVVFDDTAGMSYDGDDYRLAVEAHKADLETRLADRPAVRLADIVASRTEQIAAARERLADAKAELADAEQQLADAKTAIETAKDQLVDGARKAADQTADAVSALSSAAAQLGSATATITASQTRLMGAARKLASSQATLDRSWTQLQDAAADLDEARSQLESTKTSLDAVGGVLAAWHDRLSGDDSSATATSSTTTSLYNTVRAQYQSALDSYNTAVADYNGGLAAYAAKLDDWNMAAAELVSGDDDYLDNADAIAEAAGRLANLPASLAGAVDQAAGELADGVGDLLDGQRDIEKAEEEYAAKLAEFEDARPAAEQAIADAEERISTAQQRLANLSVDAYSVSSRTEGLTSKGYSIYLTIGTIVGKLAMVFPWFLYVVAALVTFTTMGRMVDEERGECGTLKALGYSNADVMAMFAAYGFLASTAGTLVGVVAGHVLMPLIVHAAYGDAFVLPTIQLRFHPAVTLVAVLLGWLSAVLPAVLVAMSRLRRPPAELMRPKPPANGSTILLEHVGPVWRRLDFAHKVTARNIFRYKSRMAMTVFGVCGAVAMLVAGLGVQASIRGIEASQFGPIVHYDLIVAERSDNSDAQSDEIAAALDGAADAARIRYEELVVETADDGKQAITMIATDDAFNFTSFMTLRDRVSGEPVVLTDNAVVASEGLADLLGMAVGETFTVRDSSGIDRTMTLGGTAEMYIGHFAFLTADGYEAVFGADYEPNAFIANLDGTGDSTGDDVATTAAALTALDGVRSVVQDTATRQQVGRVVNALDMIMTVLVIVAVLLACVILYNLTNLNVAERLRELSTVKVLGFTDRETTLYIYRETAWLSVAGILAGFASGELLRRYIIAEVTPADVMFDPAASWMAFAVPALLVVAVLAGLGAVVHCRLRDLDMLGALGSVE
ncbi:FtsX-like permease family protein [Bifidobacterium sp. BRDM6]|uniref:FtsX-like permease family protein n=2 Tax=Bifidobacterium choloepi TaxID=2614131 RepID=A0A6I5MY46_9BIFI|nr:FtsX-like permease family protein [Bifidobacterium choloepi]